MIVFLVFNVLSKLLVLVYYVHEIRVIDYFKLLLGIELYKLISYFMLLVSDNIPTHIIFLIE